MRITSIATGLALALTLGLTAQANAAPGAAGIADLKSTASEASLVEKTYWRTHCWWRHGHRHCDRVWVRPHGHSWGFHHHHRHHHHHHRHHWR